MKESLAIAHIVPGSGGTFYCQNCLRDLALVPALRNLGHDAYVLPLYLPLMGDDGESVKDATVFYGAVNLYLSEKFPILKKLPRKMRKWLDSKSMLKFAAGQSGRTQACGLESMTISVLKGDAGSQVEALNELISWIRLQPTMPDVIHISNALLLGLAPALKRELNVPLVCSLQDELGWIDTMAPEFATDVWELMQSSVAYVDTFISVSDYYAREMCVRLNVPDEKMTVIPIGISLDHFHPSSDRPPSPTIGFLSKMSPQYGLDLLIDAFMTLKSEKGYSDLRLKATGGMTSDVQDFLKSSERRLRAAGFWDDVEFVDDFADAARGDFLRSLTVLSVPVPNGEAFGTYQIEAMACGVPVVQPRVGAFPEVVDDTGGGVLYVPDDPTHLVTALRTLLDDRDKRTELGQAGRRAVHSRYGIDVMAKRVVDLYHSILEIER